MGIANYTLQTLLGLRKVSQATRKYCQSTNSHPEIWQVKQNRRGGCNIKEEEGAWLLGPRNGVKQKSVDEHLATLYLPRHHKDDYGVKDLLHRVTMIKGVEKIHVITSHTDWLCYIIEREDAAYPKEYLLYFSMLSSLFTSVLSPVIVADELVNLYFKSVEPVDVHGGMYPASDAAMVYHQLLDTVMFLGTAGRLNSWWTLPMERVLVGIKAKNSCRKFFPFIDDRKRVVAGVIFF
jgi:hypothetical protein